MALATRPRKSIVLRTMTVRTNPAQVKIFAVLLEAAKLLADPNARERDKAALMPDHLLFLILLMSVNRPVLH